MVIEMAPMSSRVVAALRDFGFWKAGTPLLMASTPVRAAHPEEKARSKRKARASEPRASYPSSGANVRLALSASGSRPRLWRTKPTSAIPMMVTMNR